MNGKLSTPAPTALEADELFGYFPDFVVHPGEMVDLKVSTTRPEFEYEVVRLVHGDSDPAGPGLVVEPVSGMGRGRATGQVQEACAGSYAEVNPLIVPDIPSRFTIEALISPTTPIARRHQVVAEIGARDGSQPSLAMSLALDEGGRLSWTLFSATGETHTVKTQQPLVAGRWYRVSGSVDQGTGEITVVAADLQRDADSKMERRRTELPIMERRRTELPMNLLPWGYMRLAATAGTSPTDMPRDGHFNGKIESPRILTECVNDNSQTSQDSVLAAWDFSRGIDGVRIEDTGPAEQHGTLINMPTRAVTGHAWQGRVASHIVAPGQYAAIHFHEDDLEDAKWETTASISLPDDLPSGIYAARLTAGDLVDHVPIFVSPSALNSRRRVAFLIPTFTYLAYANDLTMGDADPVSDGISNLAVDPDWREAILRRHGAFGGSLYARHTDGSGVCYSSIRRPILTMRPDYRSALTGSARLLGADLFITYFLESAGIEYDVITDHELHARGSELLDEYDVLLTGSHPEYASSEMLDALSGFTESRGSLVYLGGNGFYWVTSTARENPGVIEVRRGPAGTRTWECAPGEGTHSTTGEPGGLWRHRGRAPNRLVGVGFTSQGFDEPSPGYRVTAAGKGDDVAFIFSGVDRDQPVGDYGRVLGGAAGYEVDRADDSLGTPEDAVVVATSRGCHSDCYQVTVEDVMQTTPVLGGTRDPRVGADMVYFRTVAGGRVFSVGSLAFSGSLPHNDYENDCTRILDNVIHDFLSTNYRSADVSTTSAEYDGGTQ